MKRKVLLFILFILLLTSCQTSEIQKVDVNNMTNEQILLLVESEGFDILSPDFSCIYNNRLVFGINNTEQKAEPSLVILTEDESIEIITPEKDTKAEETLTAEIENAGELFPQEIVLNTPIEYNIPENSFISQGEEELDILAQWEAFLAEEATTEEETAVVEEATPISTELTELAKITQITIKEEPKAEQLAIEETQLAALFKREKPVLPKFKQILIQDVPQEAVFEPILEKPTAQLAAENLIEGGLIVILVFVVTLVLGAGVFLLRRHCAKKDRNQTESKY